MIKFSIITVSLNSGTKLRDTVRSILDQSYQNIEIIIKDGVSNDNSVSLVPEDTRITIISEKDCGVYDSMNQAVRYATGDYILFLNCGDYFYSNDVLQKVNKFIQQQRESVDICYGDVFVRCRGAVIKAPQILDDYHLMTRTICHQSIFWRREFALQNQYNYFEYKIAADMELYVRAIKKLHITAKYMGFIVSDYEGQGISETIEHKKRNYKENRQMLNDNFSNKERCIVILKKAMLLQYLKEWIATRKYLKNLYERISASIQRL